MSFITAEGIAKICHEANRAYCEVVNSSVRSSSWEDTDDHTRASAVAGVEVLLTDPTKTTKEMHDDWCAFKKAAGFVYGEKKDLILKTHPNLVEYDLLPVKERLKDELFYAIVTAFRQG